MRFLIALLVVTGLSPIAGAQTTRPAADRHKVGVSVTNLDHDRYAGIFWWTKKAIAAHPEIDCDYQVSGNPVEQVRQIDAMVAGGAEAIVLLPCQSDDADLGDCLKKARSRGVLVIGIGPGLDPQWFDVRLDIDARASGRKSAEFVVKKLGGKGDIVTFPGLSYPEHDDRNDAAAAVFKENPGIRILASDTSSTDGRKAGQEMMQQMLQKFPHIDAVWAPDDDIALGVIDAIKAAHRDREMWVFGGNGKKEFVKLVMNGAALAAGDVTYPADIMGTGVHLAASSVRDGKLKDVEPFLPSHLTLDVDVITRQNAKQFYFPDAAY
jgi:ribose transport system substrate-binding protein